SIAPVFFSPQNPITGFFLRAGTQLPFVGPELEEIGSRLEALPEPGSAADIAGLIAGNLLLGAAATAGAGALMGGAAGLLASRAPQLAARLPQLSPLGQTVAQEVVATPIYEALRAMAGQEPELAQSLATFGGAGAGALAAQRLFGARRLPVLGGAVVGAALGAQPFVD